VRILSWGVFHSFRADVGLDGSTGQSKPDFRDWPEYEKSDTTLPQVVFDDWFQPGWWQSSYNAWVQPLTDSSRSGMNGGVALCTKLQKDVRLGCAPCMYTPPACGVPARSAAGLQARGLGGVHDALMSVRGTCDKPRHMLHPTFLTPA
jgi:hypothetical protein